MNFRFEIPTKVSYGGKPYTMLLLKNPVIDDVLSVEARIYAAEVQKLVTTGDDHRVGRDVRDFLIKCPPTQTRSLHQSSRIVSTSS